MVDMWNMDTYLTLVSEISNDGQKPRVRFLLSGNVDCGVAGFEGGRIG